MAAERGSLRSVEQEDQIGMDERVVMDDDLEGLLEKRWRLDGDRKEIGQAFKRADDEAKELIAKHPIDEGGAIRVGRFVIKKSVPGEDVDVSFTRAGKSRLTIGLWDKADE